MPMPEAVKVPGENAIEFKVRGRKVKLKEPTPASAEAYRQTVMLLALFSLENPRVDLILRATQAYVKDGQGRAVPLF